MLFRKDIEPRCCYCAKGASIGEEQIACMHKGIVPAGHHCRKFEYDPLKRIPHRAPKQAAHTAEEFSLD